MAASVGDRRRDGRRQLGRRRRGGVRAGAKASRGGSPGLVAVVVGLMAAVLVLGSRRARLLPGSGAPRRDDPVGAPIVRVARASLGRRWRVYRTTRTYRRWRQSYASVPDPVSVYRLALAAADEQAIVRQGGRRGSSSPKPDAAIDLGRGAGRITAGARRCAPTSRPACALPCSSRSSPPSGGPGVLLAGSNPPTGASARASRSAAGAPPPGRTAAPLRRARGRVAERRLLLVLGGAAHPPPRRRQASERARLQVLVRTRTSRSADSCSTGSATSASSTSPTPQLLQQDDYGKLWRTTLPVDGEPLTVVEVVNATPEPDGTHRRYFLRVPPTHAPPARPSPGRSASTTHPTTPLRSRPDAVKRSNLKFPSQARAEAAEERRLQAPRRGREVASQLRRQRLASLPCKRFLTGAIEREGGQPRSLALPAFRPSRQQSNQMARLGIYCRASSTKRQSALTSRISSTVLQSASSRRGEQTSSTRHCAREVATLIRFLLKRTRARAERPPRSSSRARRSRPAPPGPGTCRPCRRALPSGTPVAASAPARCTASRRGRPRRRAAASRRSRP